MEEEKKTGNENVDELTFDDILKNKEYQSEFDKRVAKALETAKIKWEAGAEAERGKAAKEAEKAMKEAIAAATKPLDDQLTKALIHTELVKAKARDVEVVMPLIDTAKVTRTENGLEGLEDQIKSLKDGKSYLFEAETEPKGKTGLDHDDGGAGDDDAKIRKIMGLPNKKG